MAAFPNLVGCRFVPTDKEVVGYYLFYRIFTNREPFNDEERNLVRELDLYGSEEPWETWQQHGGDRLADGQALYFFTRLKKVSANGSRICRRVGSGTWAGEDSGEKIKAWKVDGFKKRFRYENSESPHDGAWIMHEYALDSELLRQHQKPEDIVICRIKKNPSGVQRGLDKKRKLKEEKPFNPEHQGMQPKRYRNDPVPLVVQHPQQPVPLAVQQPQLVGPWIVQKIRLGGNMFVQEFSNEPGPASSLPSTGFGIQWQGHQFIPSKTYTTQADMNNSVNIQDVPQLTWKNQALPDPAEQSPTEPAMVAPVLPSSSTPGSAIQCQERRPVPSTTQEDINNWVNPQDMPQFTSEIPDKDNPYSYLDLTLLGDSEIMYMPDMVMGNHDIL